MQYRKEINYQFEPINLEPDDLIPPAIFHTIVENGISHSLPNDQNQIKMSLELERVANKKIYTLNTYAKNRISMNNDKEGTGLKYIHSRLQENYGDQWYLESSPKDFGWQTRITLG